MKNILLSFLLIVFFFSCKSPEADNKQPQQKMGFADLAAAPVQNYDIKVNGDTVFYKSVRKTISYDSSFFELHPFNAPPDTITPDPDPEPDPNPTVVNFAFTQIPFTDPDLNRPGAGAEQWHDRNDVNLGYTPKDVYWRFVWTRLEGATEGSYNWTFFDGLVNAAINKGQKFSFGIMTVYPDGNTGNGLVAYDGGYMSYPQYLHDRMKAEAVKPWRTGSTWTPNYNSAHYTNRLLALHQALNAHILNTSYNGVKYKDVINCIDIRGYGAWGEWHSGYTPNNVVSDYPAGTFPTVTTLKKIVDAHTQGFPTFQLVCMIAGFDASWLNNTKNPPEIAHYLLTQRNQKGLIGWRRDQWGALDNYLKDYLENNNRSFAGLVFKDSIMVRYRQAPITGEPPAWNPNEYADLERQIRLYGATSFGNGNYGAAITTTLSSRVKAASKAAGYRISITKGSYSGFKGTLNITVNWTNTGIAPPYDNWTVYFDLTSSTGTVRTLTSKFQPRLFLGNTTFTDVFTGIPSGTYKIKVRISEPYRGNMPIFLREKNADNSVNLGDVTL